MIRTAAVLLLVLGVSVPAIAQVDQALAQAYFAEAKALCEREAGRLWGVSLCGPMVFADGATRTIATNQPPPDGVRPAALGFTNSPVTWSGTRWAAYVWQFIPTDQRVRGQLLMHELFHRVQPQLKLIAAAGENTHLDTLEGRYWLQLEWRALSRALTSPGAARAAALSDALAFRRARRAAFPTVAASEAADEIREGLANYTGVVMAAPSIADAITDAVRILANEETDPSFVRTFAYASGPAYGLLLDDAAPGWRQRVTATDDVAQLLAAALKIEPAADAAAASTRYRAAELRRVEDEREARQQARIAELRGRFVDGPVLIAPRPTSATVVNTGATPIPGAGIFIVEYRSTPEWGALEATFGILQGDDTVRLAAPVRTEGSTLSGDGWTVTLAPGWVVRPGARPGDFEIVRAPN